jgi:ABC-type tungstate transport system substrate-binding protein
MINVALKMGYMTAETGSSIMVYTNIYINTQKKVTSSSAEIETSNVSLCAVRVIPDS